MDVAPPPTTGSRIEELGDRLVVRFRPRRSWFLLVWLFLWAFFALSVLQWQDKGAFQLLWLAGWLLGGCFVTGMIAWQLFGRESLIVALDRIEVRKELGRFARTKRYDVPLIHGVSAERVPTGEDEATRKDFCLALWRNGETVHVGEGMGEREAEYVAALVLSRIRPRDRWNRRELPAAHAPEEPARAFVETFFRSGLFPLLVVGVLVWLAVQNLQQEEQPPAPRPAAAAPARAPMPSDFAVPREFASAMTAFALEAGRVHMLARPGCGNVTIWSAWTCVVRGRAEVGPYAGLTLDYRCRYNRPSAIAVGGTTCGPDRPPPIPATS